MKDKKQPISVALRKSLWQRVQAEAKRRNHSAASLVAIMFEACLTRLENQDADLLEMLKKPGQ